MDGRDWKDIDDTVVACTESLFGGLGMFIHPSGDDGPPTVAHMLAIIGFGGRQLRGTVLLSASRDVLARSYPVAKPGDAVSDDDLRDWSGELVNQLAGRIKHRLLARGVTLEISTPIAVSGVELRLGAAWTNEHCLPHRFEIERHQVQMRFDAVASPTAALTDACDAVQIPAPDVMLF